MQESESKEDAVNEDNVCNVVVVGSIKDEEFEVEEEENDRNVNSPNLISNVIIIFYLVIIIIKLSDCDFAG